MVLRTKCCQNVNIAFIRFPLDILFDGIIQQTFNNGRVDRPWCQHRSVVPSCTRTAQCSLSDLSRTENLKPYYFYKIAHNVRTQMEIILTTQHPTCITYARGTIKMLEWETWHCKTGLARKYQWYISMIHIKIFFLYFWYFRYFQNINLYCYYLLTFLIHAYLTKTVQVHKL